MAKIRERDRNAILDALAGGVTPRQGIQHIQVGRLAETNAIIKDIDAMDADVISFEASRGDLVVLDAIHDANFETEAGPGVYDIHSPRIPSEQEIEDRIYEILKKMDVEKVWINPDCGLKTRGNAETWPSLENLVAAAKAVRAKLAK